MLVLFESPAGYAIFKLLDEKKLHETENLFKDFETPEAASKIVKLKHFEKFQDMTEALAAATAIVEGKMSKKLKKMLKKVVVKEAHDQLAVADAKLGSVIKDKVNLSCISNSAIQELMRCIRSQMDNLISGLPSKEMTAMALGLAHSLSRYKLKFSPDKIDTMIIQAVSLLDDLDKELNNYIMRSKEWYGWHFPELSKIISDNHLYIKTVQAIGLRTNAATTDLSDILPDDVIQQVKDMAEVSMGTEISDEDMMNINHLCNEVLEIQSYRTQLFEYLKNRMMAVAPNLTVLVGELVGARLISHAGSLLNLAKHPASTVQILGAEKALFRALKTKHDTPKYGLIYHAQLVGQTNIKLKGKVSRILAAKAALACRVDALGEETNSDLGIEHRAKVERRLKFLESGALQRISGTGKSRAKFEKYENKSEIYEYKPAADSTLPTSQKRKFTSEDMGEDEEKPFKKIKTEIEGTETPCIPKKKQKLDTEDSFVDMTEVKHEETSEKKKKKKKKSKEIDEGKSEPDEIEPSFSHELSEKKKKKKKKIKDEEGRSEPDETEQSLFSPARETSPISKKKQKIDLQDTVAVMTEVIHEETSEKKKKKKKKSKEVEEGKSEPDETELSFSHELSEKKKKKKKKNKDEEGRSEPDEAEESLFSPGASEKKKKKKKSLEGLETVIKLEQEEFEQSFEGAVEKKKKKKKKSV